MPDTDAQTKRDNHTPLSFDMGFKTQSAAEEWLGHHRGDITLTTSAAPGGTLLLRPFIEQGAFVDDTARLIGPSS